MPSMPSIPGLRKSTGGEEGAEAAAATEQAAEAQAADARDDDDRSRWVGSVNLSEPFFLFAVDEKEKKTWIISVGVIRSRNYF